MSAVDDEARFVPGERFHTEIRRVYDGPLDWAVNKRAEGMARVLYEPAHENAAFDDERRGRGKDYATWIFSEERGLEEGLFATGFELMIDARLEPNAAIGRHGHPRTDEVYYVLEGSIRMTTFDAGGRERTEELRAGDAHLVRKGQGHHGVAGPDGVRFIAVATR